MAYKQEYMELAIELAKKGTGAVNPNPLVGAVIVKGDRIIARLLEHIGMKREQCICCGDGFNDKTMVEYAGVGVAMGNAQQVVKDVADYVTASCDEDGLVEVIKKFVL